jgi:uncharacterized protein
MADLLSALASFMPKTNAPEDVFMALGSYRFSISTAVYESFKRETKWRWASQERLSRTPAKQYVGPGEDTITLEGVVYPHFRGGLEQIDNIRAEADKEEPLLLVDGLGYVYDYWVVTSLSETHTALWQKGVPLKQQFTLTLEYFGEDEGNAAAQSADAAQAATDAASATPASGLAGAVAGLKDQISSGIEAIKNGVSDAAGPLVEQATQSLQSVGSAVKDVTEVIGTVQSQVSTVLAAKQSVDTLTSSIKNVTSALGSIGQGSTLAGLSRVGNSLKQLQTSAGSASKALSSADGIMSKSSAAIGNSLTNLQNVAYSAKSSLSKLSSKSTDG